MRRESRVCTGRVSARSASLHHPKSSYHSLASSRLSERLRLCAQIELLGRVQRQEQDMAWYTCINHVQVLGKPLYNFRPVPPGNPEGLSGSHRQGATGGTDNGPQDSRPQLVLEAVREDPMVARGGLMALSEGACSFSGWKQRPQRVREACNFLLEPHMCILC